LKSINLSQKTAYLLLLLLILFSYRSAINSYFIHDDFCLIADWGQMSLSQAFNNNDNKIYRPLFLLSNRFAYQVFGVDHRLYHCYSLFLHFLNAVLVLVISRLLFKQSSAARHIFTAAIFCVNPILPEAVAWYAASHVTLGALFILSGLLCYILSKPGGKRKLIYYFLLMACFILGLLSSEIVFIFPLILLLTDIFLMKERAKTSNRPKEYLLTYGALAIICVLYALKRISILGSFLGDWSAYEHAKLTLANFINSLRILAVPLNVEIYSPNFILRANILIFLLLGALLFLRLSKIRLNKNSFYWSISLFLASLLVNLKFQTIWPSLGGGRFWYFPAACFAFVLGDLFWGYLDNSRSKIIRNCVYAIAIFLVIFYTYAVQKNTSVWREAGDLTQKIQKKLIGISGDKKYIVVKSIPENHKGAHVFMCPGSFTDALSPPFVENKTKVYRYEDAPAELKNDKKSILIWGGEDFESMGGR